MVFYTAAGAEKESDVQTEKEEDKKEEGEEGGEGEESGEEDGEEAGMEEEENITATEVWKRANNVTQ